MIRGIGVAEFDAKRGSHLIDCRPSNIATREALAQITPDAVELSHDQLVLKRERENLAIHVQHVQVVDLSARGGKRLYAVLVFTDLNHNLSAKDLERFRSDFERRISEGGSDCIQQFVSTNATKIAIDDLFEHRIPTDLRDITCAILKTDTGELLRSNVPQNILPYVKNYASPMREMHNNTILFTAIPDNQRDELLVCVRISPDISAIFSTPYSFLQRLLAKIPEYVSYLGGDETNIHHLINTLVATPIPDLRKQSSQALPATGIPGVTAVTPSDYQVPSTMLIKAGDTSGSSLIETTIDILSSLLQRGTIPPTCILFHEEEAPSRNQRNPVSNTLAIPLIARLKDLASTCENAIFATVKVDTSNKKKIAKEFNTSSFPSVVIVDSPSPGAPKRFKVFPTPAEGISVDARTEALMGDIKRYLSRTTPAQRTKATSPGGSSVTSETSTQLPQLITETTVIHVKRTPNSRDLAEDPTKTVWRNILDGMPVRDLFKACKSTKIDPSVAKTVLLQLQKEGVIDLKELL